MKSHLTTAVSVAVFGLACAGSKGMVDDPAALADVPDSVYIEVVNEHFYDARVHAIYEGGGRHTLGTVPGNGGHAEVALGFKPRALTFVVSFIINNERYVTDPIDAVRGEILALTVPPHIEASGFFTRVSR